MHHIAAAGRRRDGRRCVCARGYAAGKAAVPCEAASLSPSEFWVRLAPPTLSLPPSLSSSLPLPPPSSSSSLLLFYLLCRHQSN